MAVNNNSSNVVSAKAGATVGQYKIVMSSGTASTLVVATASTDVPVGISQNGASAGDAIRVAQGGISKLVANSAVTAGSRIISGAGGFGTMGAAGAGTTTVGVALTGADGSACIFEVLVSPDTA